MRLTLLFTSPDLPVFTISNYHFACSRLEMSLPVIPVAGNGLSSGSQRFQVKGKIIYTMLLMPSQHGRNRCRLHRE
jgi:hypothetical protein